MSDFEKLNALIETDKSKKKTVDTTQIEKLSEERLQNKVLTMSLLRLTVCMQSFTTFSVRNTR